MSTAINHPVSRPVRFPVRYAMLAPLACMAAMMLMTFSLVGREAGTTDIDWIAKVKLLARACSGIVLLALIASQITRRVTRFAMSRMVWFGLFLGWAVCSTIWSPLKSITLGQAGSLVILSLLSICIATFWRSRKETRQVLCVLSVMLVLISGSLLALRIAMPGSGSLQRAGEGLLHATNASATASLALLVLLPAVFLWRWRWARLIALVAIPLHMAVLFFAANRTCLVLTPLLSLLFMIFLGNRKLTVIGVCGLCLAALGYLCIDPSFQLAGGTGEQIAGKLMRGQSTKQILELSGRNELWEIVWESYLQSPWIGHGYFVTSSTGEIEVWYRNGNFPAHNIWLQALATTGLVGLVLFALGLAGTWLQTAFQLWQAPSTRAFSWLVLLVTCWYLGWSLTSDSLLGPVQPESVIFFTLLGLAMGELYGQSRDRQKGAAR